MADYSQYPDSIYFCNDDDESSEAFMADAIGRALRYHIPYRVLREVFSGADKNGMSADECALMIDNIIDATIWGAANAKHVLNVRQVEQTEDEGYDVDGGEE